MVQATVQCTAQGTHKKNTKRSIHYVCNIHCPLLLLLFYFFCNYFFKICLKILPEKNNTASTHLVGKSFIRSNVQIIDYLWVISTLVLIHFILLH